MSEQSKKIPCCIGLLAHVDAGKTTLSEAMLFESGERRSMGRVDHRDAFLDTHNLERERGITIFSKLARLSLDGLDVTLVDTPGHVDFAPEAERVMPVLDCAILVINSTDGIQAHTITLWELLQRHQIPTFLFLNKMDLPGKGKEALLQELKQTLSPGILDFSAPPEQIFEESALCDEALLEQYLRSGVVTDGNLQGLIASRRIFPAYFGSALKSQGVAEFLDLLRRFAPEPQYSADFAARVYKISRDPQGNRLTWMKLTGGSLAVRTPLSYLDRQGKERTEKCVQLRLYSGNQFTQTDLCHAGTIVAVTGLTGTYAGQALGQENEFISSIEPVMSYRLVLPKGKDPLTVLPLLRQLEEEEPQLRVQWDEGLGQLRLFVMGSVQLEILQGLLRERFSLDVTFDQGQISYRETIENTVEGVGHFEPLRHYAEVHLLLQPGEPGSGVTFDTDCPTDVLDLPYQKLILTHIGEKQHLGVLTGSPITDIHITLKSGRAHLKHTEGGDFRQATYRAIRQGLMQAKSRLLEPWYDFTLTVPASQIGRGITDIRAMGGIFDTPESSGSNAILRGKVPVAQVGDYPQEVASYTKGLGIFQTRMAGYLPCHNPEAVVATFQYDPEGDLENTPDSVFCAHGAGFNVKWNQVPTYMHLSSVLEKPAQPQILLRNLRMDDRELEAIMEREFGPVKRRQYTAPANRPATDPLPIAPPKKQLLLVDGYNLLFASSELEELAAVDLGLARQRLIETLGSYAAYRSLEVYLIFDGYKAKGNPGEKNRWEALQIVYTREGQTADAYLEALAAKIGGNHSVRIVTSDALVQLSAFRSGLLRMSARELWEEIDRAQIQMRQFLSELEYRENRKFKEKEVPKCTT